MQQAQHIRALVQTYGAVPGLVLASVAFMMALSGIFSILMVRWLYHTFEAISPSLANTAALISLNLPLVLYLLAIYYTYRYYSRSVGLVKASPQIRVRITAELIIAFIVYLFVGPDLDRHFHSPVSITLLIVAAFLMAHWWLLARTHRHYLLLAVVVVILSFVPLFSPFIYHWLYMDPAPDWYTSNMNACAGLVLALAGLLDHWQMVHTLRQIRGEIIAEHNKNEGASHE